MNNHIQISLRGIHHCFLIPLLLLAALFFVSNAVTASPASKTLPDTVVDFPSMGRAYAKRDVRMLLVPAWDFDVDAWLHSRMAILRGVESGFAIARAASDGSVTLSDDRGRVLSEAPSSLGTDATLVGTLPVKSAHTLYARWGNWFAWLDLAALIVLLWLASRPARH